MNKVILKTMLTLSLVVGFSVLAISQLNLPRKSPKASTSYTIGMTEVTINYSSPAVNDRNIWGELVPWGKIWRAGANEATTIEFSTDVVMEGKPLPKGKYSFFVIPQQEGKWTAIFNKVADQWGAYQYNEAEDALRIEVKAKMVKVSEKRLNFSIVDQAMDKGYIRLAWDKMRMYLRFRVEFVDEAIANVEAAAKTAEEKDLWSIYGQGAEFLLNNDKQLDKAKEWALKSTELFNHSWNWWIRAQVLAANGDYLGAVESAEQSAKHAAANDKDRFYDSAKTEIEAAVAKWKTKK